MGFWDKLTEILEVVNAAAIARSRPWMDDVLTLRSNHNYQEEEKSKSKISDYSEEEIIEELKRRKIQDYSEEELKEKLARTREEKLKTRRRYIIK